MKRLSLDEKTMEQARRMIVAITTAVVLVALGFAIQPIVMNAREKSASGDPQASVALTEDELTPAKESIAVFLDERSKNRTVTIAQLNSIIDDERTDADTRRQAQNQLLSSSRTAEQETKIEGLVMALGYEQCVASVGGDTCTVVVKTESLTRQQAAQILDIACRETGMLSGDVKIIPVE